VGIPTSNNKMLLENINLIFVMKVILLITLSVVFMSCQVNKDKKLLIQRAVQNDTVKICESKICLSIISSFVDPDNDIDSFSAPLYTRQIITITNAGKTILTKDHGNKKTTTNFKGSNIEILENYINQISVLKNVRNEVFFCIEGYGGCSDCSVYSAIINSNGEFIYVLYEDKVDTFESKGILMDVLNQAGISWESFKDKDMIDI